MFRPPGGLNGTVVDPASLFGWSIDPVGHPKRYAVVCLAALLLAALVAGNIRRGRAGRRLVAVRGNERAAASLGISVYGAKLYSFALAAAIAGLGGVLLSFQAGGLRRLQPVQRLQLDRGRHQHRDQRCRLPARRCAGRGEHTAGGLTPKIFGEIFPNDDINQYVTLALAVLLTPTLIQFPNGLAAKVATLRPPAALTFGRITRRPPAEADQGDDASAGPGKARASVPPAPAHRVPPKVLEVRDVAVSFGGVQALGGVSLEVRPGEAVGLMGPNGAGKTTFIDAVTGFNRIQGGTIHLDGVQIDAMTARRRARLGIGRTFQSLELFDQLTILENLRTASDPRDSAAYLTDLVRPRHTQLTPAARSAIHMFELADDLDRVPSVLSYGRRRQVAIARAIATEPSILLLDEPAAGLNETETRELADLLRRLVDEWGIGILLVEHDVPMLNRVCDRLVVMDFGTVIATGTPAEIRTNPRVIAAYLGAETEAADDEEVAEVTREEVARSVAQEAVWEAR